MLTAEELLQAIWNTWHRVTIYRRHAGWKVDILMNRRIGGWTATKPTLLEALTDAYEQMKKEPKDDL